MKGERCILCRGHHPTAVGAQRGLSPGPRLPMGAHVCGPHKHLRQQTSVTPPVQPFSCASSGKHTPPPAVVTCWKIGESEKEREKVRERCLRLGQRGGTGAGDPPSSCDKLETVCVRAHLDGKD